MTFVAFFLENKGKVRAQTEEDGVYELRHTNKF